MAFEQPEPLTHIEELSPDLQLLYTGLAYELDPEDRNDFAQALNAGLMALRHFPEVEPDGKFIVKMSCLAVNSAHPFSMMLPGHQEPFEGVKDLLVFQQTGLVRGIE